VRTMLHPPFEIDIHYLSRSQSGKTQLDEAARGNVRKTSRRKLRQKLQPGIAENIQLKETARMDTRKSKKRDSRMDWQRLAANPRSRIKDHAKSARTFLTIEADSLKLLTAKQSQHPRKLESSRKKFRNIAAVTTMCVGDVSRTSDTKSRTSRRLHECPRDVALFCESTTSDDASSDSEKQSKTMKKKQKKKKWPQSQKLIKRGVQRSKHAIGTKTLDNNA